MTTTPDSRIRADWTLPADTAAPPPSLEAIDTSTTATPDTSTTAGKIAVMQAHERGERVEARVRKSAMPNWYQVDAGELVWDWKFSDYRIAPPTAPRSALHNARSRMKSVLADEATAGDVQLAILVREIDSSPILHIHGSGSQANIDWTKTDSGPLTPGRYRLVRDDA